MKSGVGLRGRRLTLDLFLSPGQRVFEIRLVLLTKNVLFSPPQECCVYSGWGGGAGLEPGGACGVGVGGGGLDREILIEAISSADLWFQINVSQTGLPVEIVRPPPLSLHLII